MRIIVKLMLDGGALPIPSAFILIILLWVLKNIWGVIVLIQMYVLLRIVAI